jgi:hypothetical protein
MTLISSQTASGSASIEFTSGIDSTYPIYKFEFINMHPATDNVDLTFNMSIDSGSNYNVTKTSTFFAAYNFESDTGAALNYQSARDLAQSTSFQILDYGVGNGNDESCSGFLTIFNPSSTTFVKHYISQFSSYNYQSENDNQLCAGYGNTTSAVDAIQFKMSSGNIDDGTIKLYGIGE